MSLLFGGSFTIRNLLLPLLAMNEVFVKLCGMNTTVINYADIISYLLNKILNFSYINTVKVKVSRDRPRWP